MLKAEVERLGTQRAFAKKTGVDSAILSKTLAGKFPDHIPAAILKALGKARGSIFQVIVEVSYREKI